MLSLSLISVTVAVASDELDAVGMLQAQRKMQRSLQSHRHTTLWKDDAKGQTCLPVVKGDKAPIIGHYTAAGAAQSVDVNVGQVAPGAGQFCIDTKTFSLLQRSLGLHDASAVEATLMRKNEQQENEQGDVEASVGGKNSNGGDVENSACGKNGCEKFALEELGPFRLVPSDVRITFSNRTSGTYTAGGNSGKIALETTPPLDEKGSMFWNGASKVDWYYQTDGAPGDATGFERYGGFVLEGTSGTSNLEIDNNSTDPVMTLQFDEPFRISEQQWSDCVNPAPVTFQHLLDKGVHQYCWETDHEKCERGCFFYNTTSGFQGFAVHDFAFHSLGPFHLEERNDLVQELGEVNRTEFFAQSQNEQGKILQLAALSNQGSDFWLGAKEVAWAYQAADVAADAGSFEKYGGFVLIDEDNHVSHALEIFMEGLLDRHELTIQFGDPFHVSEEMWNSCQNPASITINGLLDVGAQQYCWEADGAKCQRGCFLYKTTKGYQGFAVKPYSFDSLGPFKLKEIADQNLSTISITGSLDHWTTQWSNGKASGGPLLSDDAKNFWNTDEDRVYWAYPSPEFQLGYSSAIWENMGGFLIKRNGSLSVNVIDNSQSEADADKIVNFGPPFHVTKEEWEECHYSSPITIPALLSQNVMKYCWYDPGVGEDSEEADADSRCRAGCFFYKTQEGYQGFGVKLD